MRSPSARILTNACDVYPFVPSQDADGGGDPASNYAASPTYTAVPCSAQNTETGRDDGSLGGPRTANTWFVMFAPSALAYALKINDKLVLSVSGRTHTAFVVGDADGAGRGSYDGVTAEERV
jgi:hypothetical protein